MTCRQCGEKQHKNKPNESPKASEEDPRKRWKASSGTPLTTELDRWAETKCQSGVSFVARGMYEEALNSFRQAVDQQVDFLDARLWIARLSLDEKEKREQYGEILANVSNHLEATRELMVLNGQLSREEADRTINADEQIVLDADVPVKATLVEIDCSNCGGSLEVPAGGGILPAIPPMCEGSAMNDMLTVLEHWKLDVRAVRERVYRDADSARTRTLACDLASGPRLVRQPSG